MRIIVKAMAERFDDIAYLRRHLPRLELVLDTKRDAFDTFLRGLALAGDDASIQMQDDIILTLDFESKAAAVIAEHPDRMIQFFSMRKDDLSIGSRWDNNWLMHQCFYLPPGYAKELIAFYPAWKAGGVKYHHGYDDVMVCAWLRSRKEKYWLHCPSLVEHRLNRSAIWGRTFKRQSKTFVDPV